MVAYFKLQNNLFMVGGGLIGFLLALLNYAGLSERGSYATVFLIAMYAFAGVIVGRVLSSFFANRRVKSMTALLYQQGKPAEFLEKFEPLSDKVPDNVVEYVDAKNKVAYAYEALGEFEKGLAVVDALKPEELKLHSLAGTSLTENQRMRFYLLSEDIEKAETQLARLKELREEAEGRANTLANNLKECVKLAENWLNFLKNETYDTVYIEEEIRYAGNRIHKSEMQLLLARMRHAQGQEDAARQLLKEAETSGEGLYAGAEAKRLAAAWVQ